MGRHSRNAVQAVAPTRNRQGHRGPRRRHSAVRTGLLASSAALAVGAVAMSSGLLPSLNGTPGGLTAQGSPGGTRTQPNGSSGPSLPDTGSPSPSTGRPTVPSSPTTTRGHTPPATPPTSAAAPTTTPAPEATPTRTPVTPRPTTPAPAPTHTATPVPTPSQGGTAVTAQAAVLQLVNAERAKVGCSPVTADASLTQLAQAFSEDMAVRDFFDHTNPDGATPWDRAKSAHVKNLGGENIARGQADAVAVMTAWMNSAGHRANILNCEYKTLGIGVRYAPGGPWWTQDFGF